MSTMIVTIPLTKDNWTEIHNTLDSFMPFDLIDIVFAFCKYRIYSFDLNSLQTSECTIDSSNLEIAYTSGKMMSSVHWIDYALAVRDEDATTINVEHRDFEYDQLMHELDCHIYGRPFCNYHYNDNQDQPVTRIIPLLFQSWDLLTLQNSDQDCVLILRMDNKTVPIGRKDAVLFDRLQVHCTVYRHSNN